MNSHKIRKRTHLNKSDIKQTIEVRMRLFNVPTFFGCCCCCCEKLEHMQCCWKHERENWIVSRGTCIAHFSYMNTNGREGISIKKNSRIKWNGARKQEEINAARTICNHLFATVMIKPLQNIPYFPLTTMKCLAARAVIRQHVIEFNKISEKLWWFHYMLLYIEGQLFLIKRKQLHNVNHLNERARRINGENESICKLFHLLKCSKYVGKRST